MLYLFGVKVVVPSKAVQWMQIQLTHHNNIECRIFSRQLQEMLVADFWESFHFLTPNRGFSVVWCKDGSAEAKHEPELRISWSVEEAFILHDGHILCILCNMINETWDHMTSNILLIFKISHTNVPTHNIYYADIPKVKKAEYTRRSKSLRLPPHHIWDNWGKP